ncbi:MAG TPA: hypothetical protein VFZ37_14540 [Jiangellaceae bacterium]
MTTRPHIGPALNGKSVHGQALLDEMRGLWDPTGTLLSVVVTVPPDPTALREFPARFGRLLAATRPVRGVNGVRGGERRLEAARDAVRRAVSAEPREWFGRTMVIVASADGGVLGPRRLPCAVPDVAVFGRRPHLRSVVRAHQACRPFSVVVLDRRHAWLFDISGDTVHPVRRLEGDGVRAHAYAGWYGLEELRTRRHKSELERRHYHATAAALERRGPPSGRPLVVGGHKAGVAEFLAALAAPLRGRIAGTFTIDPHTMTPNEVRVRSTAVMAEWEAARRRQLAAELAAWEATGLAVHGVVGSAEAVSRSLADLLVVRGDELIPGSVCDQCGMLGMITHRCRNCVAPVYPVPDVIDEMVARMLDNHGRLDLAGAAHGVNVAVRLHHDALAKSAARRL